MCEKKTNLEILTQPETEAYAESQKQTHRVPREGLEVWKRGTEAGRECKQDLLHACVCVCVCVRERERERVLDTRFRGRENGARGYEKERVGAVCDHRRDAWGLVHKPVGEAPGETSEEARVRAGRQVCGQTTW